MNLPAVERCQRCGEFYPKPAASNHAADKCRDNLAARPLPTREPSPFRGRA